jgi:hypothetical protein
VTLVVLGWVGFLVIRPQNPPPQAPGYRLPDEFRRVLFPLCTLFALCGVLAGLQPPAPRSPRRAGLAAFSTLLALVAGVVIMVPFMVIPHLVLVAVEAVSMSTDAHYVPHSGLVGRIRGASLPAALAMGACLMAGTWLSLGLRRSARGERAFSRFECFDLGLCLAAALGGSAYLVGHTIPDIHETILTGLTFFLAPMDLAAAVAGLAGLSAGIVARAVGRVGEPASPTWSARLAQVPLLLFVLVLLLMAAMTIDREAPGYRVLAWVNPLRLSGWFAFLASYPMWDQIWAESLPVVLVGPALAWAAWETLRLCGPWAPDRPSAFDVALALPAGPVRLPVLAAAITTLALAALPVFFVAGLVVYQWRLLGWSGF